jgi:hypothetical protein
MLDEPNDDGYNGSSQQDFVDSVIEVLHNQLVDTFDMWWLELVRSIIVDSIIDGAFLNSFLQIGFEFSSDTFNTLELLNDHFGAQDHVAVGWVLVVVIKDYNVTI